MCLPVVSPLAPLACLLACLSKTPASAHLSPPCITLPFPLKINPTTNSRGSPDSHRHLPSRPRQQPHAGPGRPHPRRLRRIRGRLRPLIFHHSRCHRQPPPRAAARDRARDGGRGGGAFGGRSARIRAAAARAVNATAVEAGAEQCKTRRYRGASGCSFARQRVAAHRQRSRQRADLGCGGRGGCYGRARRVCGGAELPLELGRDAAAHAAV